ncbi:DeoR/GlpR family DNA-binding transcription regulator [Mycetocola sp. JXN-3]|uniref:DeoR/GlpR family DNA-binding transcription regulator n=1 Tax=Mycetocola sp. JXN-3 TaxID=2116510 RepID=UPI00165D1575|nr:DeoR/GlpR family DNA-binding transcription regulator [Mycetocola sp. JXN-3]
MTEMLPPQRHTLILERLRRDGQVRVTTLATELAVSEMTVRRDLGILADRGDLAKTHGGATLPGGTTSSEPGFAHNLRVAAEEKEQIAQVAAERVRPGMSIALNAGTTTHTLARRLALIPDLTVITNSPRIAAVFDEGGTGQTVILTGGIRTPSDALVGPFAVQTLRALRVDVCFLGVHGVSPEGGLTTPNLLEAETNRAFIESAASVVVVADHHKWGVTGLCQIAELDAADVFLSDAGLEDAARDRLAESIDSVIRAGDPTDPARTPETPQTTTPNPKENR